jgi:sarcosine oxidase subunit alpha
MTQSLRHPKAGRIDRSRPLRFRFDGREYTGFVGDTLASALLANGVRVTARSFKYHRPRGLMAAGFEEANTLVQLGQAARTEPNQRATQIALSEGLQARAVNCWPNARHDVFGFFRLFKPFWPAGFYYKTFMAPSWHWW